MQKSNLFQRKVYETEDHIKFEALCNHVYSPIYLSNLYIDYTKVEIKVDHRPDIPLLEINSDLMYLKVAYLFNGKLKGFFDCFEGDKLIAPNTLSISSENVMIANKFENYVDIVPINITGYEIMMNANNFQKSISVKSSLLDSAMAGEILPEFSITELIEKINKYYNKQIIV